MKARTILLLLLAAAVTCAQTAPPSQKAAPAAGKPATTQAQPAATAKSKPVAPSAKPAAMPTAKPAQAKPAAKPAAPAKKAVARAKSAAQPAAGAVKPAAARTSGAGKRDPFISVVVRGGAGGPGPACETGKKCLDVNAVVLRGIVKSPNGMIAVVENATRRITYFLRENDPVFNGYVLKITLDSIIFRENVIDNLGKASTRDVVKRVSAPAV